MNDDQIPEYLKRSIYQKDPTNKYYVEDKNYPKVLLPYSARECFFINDKYYLPNYVINLNVIKNIKLKNDDTIVIGKYKNYK